MMRMKFPKIFSGKVREHPSISEADGKTVDYRRRFGEIFLRLTNYYAPYREKKDFSLFIEIGSDPKNDEFGLYQEMTSCGNPEKCSDEAIEYLSRYLSKLDSIRGDLRKTIDFLANTMVGNGDLTQHLTDFDDAYRDMEKLDETMDLLFKEKDDE